jgi:hypothetical protein
MNRLKAHADAADLETLERLEIARRALKDAERKAKPVKKRLKAKSAWQTKTVDRQAVRSSPATINPRQPRERDKAYLGFIRQLPCIATLIREGREVYGVDAAHVRAGYAEDGWASTGLQTKPHDWRCVPLTREQHLTGPAAQHKSGERFWWERLGVYPPDLCAELRAAFPDLEAAKTVIRRHAQSARAAP